MVTVTRARGTVAALLVVTTAAAIALTGVLADQARQNVAGQAAYLDAVNGDVLASMSQAGLARDFNDLGWTDLQLLTAGQSVCDDTTAEQLLIDYPGRLGRDGAQIIVARARQHLC